MTVGTIRNSKIAGAAWALLATCYWCGIAWLYLITYFSLLLLLAATCAFVLLCWALRDGAEGRPRGSTWALGAVSAFYASAASWTVGIAAFIEGHGCALQPETCTGGEVPLMWKAAAIAIILYFGAAWLVNGTVAARRARAG